jgi:hypothetical protein
MYSLAKLCFSYLQSWEELEKEAVNEDKMKRRNEEQQDDSHGRPKKQQRR